MDEVWWARRHGSYMDLYSSKEDAQLRTRMLRCMNYYDWTNSFAGPVLEQDEIIPIRPLRIEAVRFPLPEPSEVEGAVEKGGEG